MFMIKVVLPGTPPGEHPMSLLDFRPVVGDEMELKGNDGCMIGVYVVARCVHSLNCGFLTVYLKAKESECQEN